jgi:hypothetical protein
METTCYQTPASNELDDDNDYSRVVGKRYIHSNPQHFELETGTLSKLANSPSVLSTKLENIGWMNDVTISLFLMCSMSVHYIIQKH